MQDDRRRATEEDLEARLNGGQAAGAGGGKAQPPAKGGKGAPAKGAGGEELAADESTETSSLDFSKPVEYNLVGANGALNSSSLAPSLYLSGLESLVRFDLRYAQYLTMIRQEHEQAEGILTDTAKLVPRCLYLSPQLRFYQAFLVGHVNRMKFYDKVLEFQAQYTKRPKYKESFVRHVPHGSIALGHFLIELPNFSERL